MASASSRHWQEGKMELVQSLQWERWEVFIYLGFILSQWLPTTCYLLISSLKSLSLTRYSTRPERLTGNLSDGTGGNVFVRVLWLPPHLSTRWLKLIFAGVLLWSQSPESQTVTLIKMFLLTVPLLNFPWGRWHDVIARLWQWWKCFRFPCGREAMINWNVIRLGHSSEVSRLLVMSESVMI